MTARARDRRRARRRTRRTRPGSAARTGSRRWWRSGPGGRPGMVASSDLRSVCRRRTESSRAAVYRCRGVSKISVVVPVSASRPAYMTNTRSACPATTPMSWVISRVAMPSVWRSRSNSSMICAWVVTSRAVVGSSAISSLGSADQRGGDDHALAHPARQLVREAVQLLARAGQPDQVEHLGRGGAGRRPGSRPAAARSVSPTCAPMRRVGLSDVIGSWKTMPTSAPAHPAQVPLGEAGQLAVTEPDAAPHLGVGGQQPGQGQAQGGLAAAGLADDADGLALGHLEAHAPHRVHHRAAQPDVDVQVGDLEHRCPPAHLPCPLHWRLVSRPKASRSPSPIRLKATTVTTIAMPGG